MGARKRNTEKMNELRKLPDRHAKPTKEKSHRERQSRQSNAMAATRCKSPEFYTEEVIARLGRARKDNFSDGFPSSPTEHKYIIDSESNPSHANQAVPGMQKLKQQLTAIN